MLLLVIVAGLLIRIAVVFHPGHQPDFSLFEGWAEKGATVGVVNIYDADKEGLPPDYPPLLLYAYTAVGITTQWLQGDVARTPLFVALMKTPAIVADVVVTLLLAAFGARISRRREGILAGALYFLLPASWIDSAIWGQVDSVYVLFLLVAFTAIGDRRFLLSGAAAGLAFSTKFQTVAFLPMLAVLAVAIDWRGMLRGLLAFTVTVSAVFAPFALAGKLGPAVSVYSSAVGAYPVLSVNAFNTWRLIFGKAAGATSDAAVVAGLSYRAWGLLAFLIASLASLAFVWRRMSSEAELRFGDFPLRAAAVSCLIFFAMPTEIHDRYLFPMLVFAAPWAARGAKEFTVYVILSLSIGLNIAFPISMSATDSFFATLPFADRIVSACILSFGTLATYMLLKVAAGRRDYIPLVPIRI